VKTTRLFLLGAALFGFVSLDNPARASIGDILHAQGFHDGPIFRQRDDNADYIKVRINGHTLTLLVDTGAETMIWRDTARDAGIAEGKIFGKALGVDGVADTRAAVAQVTSFTIGGVELAPAPVLIVASPSGNHLPCDGLLGLTLMKRNQVFFGYDPALFFFRPDGPARVTGLDAFMLRAGYARVNLIDLGRRYSVPLTLNHSVADMILDSGAFATMVRWEFATKAQLAPTSQKLTVSGLKGKGFRATVVNPQRIAIGPLALPAIPIGTDGPRALEPEQPGDFDGLLGFDLVGRLYPLLDTVDNWLYVWPVRP
jgi:predicted aspartyl protease